MKTRSHDDSLSITAMRVSRILASLTFAIGGALLASPGFIVAAPSPPATLAITAIAASILFSGIPRTWSRIVGVVLAAFASVIAWLSLVPLELVPVPDLVADVATLMLLLNSAALLLAPLASRGAARGFALFTGAALLVFTTSLAGLALGNTALASLGFDHASTLTSTLLCAMPLFATLSLRRDAGWLSVLWRSSATGGLARGMVAWTVVAPLGFALIALAGVRAGFFSLDFAFALLVAAMCGGLTFLVLWNATRVDRAQRRAETARDAAMLASNRLRLAQTATGVLMWEWVPHLRRWSSLDGEGHFDPATNDYLDLGLARCLRDGAAEFEFPVRRPGIEDQWMLATCWREMREGHPVVVGVSVDVTERKFAILALEASETRLQLAARALPGFVYDWDRATDRLVRSSGIEQLLGFVGPEISPASHWWDDLIHPEDRDSARPARVAAVSGADSVVDNIASEYRVQHKNGGFVWIWDHCILVRDRSGEVVRVVGSVLDITDRKQTLAQLASTETRQREAEQRVRESLQRLELALDAERAARTELAVANQAKDEFLATISHELRTPLNAILGWTTLLQRPNVDTTTIADGLRVIERNARAQTQLLGDLLDANQMMSGKLSLNFEPMDLNDAVRATLDSMRVSIATRKVRIESRLADAQLPVMGDSGRLQQIVSNLLSNALKFTPADGVVTVVTGTDPDGLYCEVRDSGEGIAAEFLPHIFEKFRQAEGGSSRRFAGLGLGLAITKQLVESHGGSIGVASAGIGKGATFTIRLPRLRAEFDATDLDAHRYALRTPDKPLAGLTILAVDDEMDSREYLERLLTEQGARLVSVATAHEALEALSNTRFDLLVSDIGMPGTTGYDLIDTVRQRMMVDGNELPAVALTAFTRPEDRAQALQRGFQKHLTKPVQVGRLIGAIRNLTGRAATGVTRARMN